MVQILILLAGGMPLFDSVTTSFATAGTGGFAIKNDSMAGYSPFQQGVVTVFMALFGVNFEYLLFAPAAPVFTGFQKSGAAPVFRHYDRGYSSDYLERPSTV